MTVKSYTVITGVHRCISSLVMMRGSGYVVLFVTQLVPYVTSKRCTHERIRIVGKYIHGLVGESC